MSKHLSSLVEKLQESISHKSFTSDVLENITRDLKSIGYSYNEKRFPRLSNTEEFITDCAASPTNLAEALLWKIGKWESYQNFTKYYTGQFDEPKTSDVVFYAFAKHLKDNMKPIYDQHVLRAMWAINPALSDEEKTKIRNHLMTKGGKWKTTGSGNASIDCYQTYVCFVQEIWQEGNLDLRKLDLMLMPLGQALKKFSNGHKEFSHLCGW